MHAMSLGALKKIEEKPLEYVEIETPSPAEDEVIIKVVSCGVCRSNLHLIEGDWVEDLGLPGKLPIIPGHELTGKVEEIGSKVEQFKAGDMVGMQVLWKSCGKCEYCISGRENICPHQKITGETVDGGYAEYVVGKEEHVYKLPSGIDPVTSSPLFCAGITAFRAVKRSNITPTSKVAIIGLGGVGHMAVQMAMTYGSEVFAISSSEYETRTVKSVGGNHVEVIDSGPHYEIPKEYYRKFDSVVVFVPYKEAVKAAVEVLKPAGRMVLGTHSVIDNFRPFDEIEIVGTLVGTRKDMIDTLKLAANQKVRVMTSVFKLEDANEALLKLKHREVEGRIVLKP